MSSAGFESSVAAILSQAEPQKFVTAVIFLIYPVKAVQFSSSLQSSSSKVSCAIIYKVSALSCLQFLCNNYQHVVSISRSSVLNFRLKFLILPSTFICPKIIFSVLSGSKNPTISANSGKSKIFCVRSSTWFGYRNSGYMWSPYSSRSSVLNFALIF